jgi:hypothetical protein
VLSKSQLRITIAVMAVLLLGITGAGRVAFGSIGTFATFSTGSGTAFNFFNNGASGGDLQTGGTDGSASAIPVTFQFLVPNSSSFGTGTINALLTVTSTTTNGSGASGFGLSVQPMTTTTFTFTSGANTLLTVTSNVSTLYGVSGGRTATLADTSGAGNTITYTSPDLALSSTNNSYAVSLVGLSSQLGLGSNGVLNGFHSSGSGSFSSAPVPEASTLISFGLLVLCGGLLLVRNKKNFSKKEA